MKVAIIGTGISGLSMAKLLENHHQVILFERQNKAGGLIKCERVNDCLFHKVGGHVFNSKNRKVLDWFWSYFDRSKEFVSARRKAKVFYKNSIIGYPIENYLYLLEKEETKKIVTELLALREQRVKTPFEYDNFEDFLKGSFGCTLYENYFKPYNTKIWQTDLKTVAMEWLEGKLPMPNLLDILQNNIIREEENDMVHSTFFYPKEGGSQFIIDRLSQGLKIKVNVDIHNIKRVKGKFIIGEDNFDSVVYTGNIKEMPTVFDRILSDNSVNLGYLKNLRSNGTSNIFCESDFTDISWLYIPEPFTKAHRIIYTGNFSESNNRGSNRITCVVEFSGNVSYDIMSEEIKKLPGNLKPLAYNYEPNSYVVQDKYTRLEIGKAKVVFEKYNIFLLGRFAEWEYYNMDKAVEAAFILSKNFK